MHCATRLSPAGLARELLDRAGNVPRGAATFGAAERDLRSWRRRALVRIPLYLSGAGGTAEV